MQNFFLFSGMTSSESNLPMKCLRGSCAESFATLQELDRHIFECHYLMTKAFKPKERRKNGRTILKVDLYKCEVCKMEYRQRSALVKHQERNHFRVNLAQRRQEAVKQPQQLQQQQQQQQIVLQPQPSVVLVECNICHEKFGGYEFYSTHVLTEHSDRLVKCENCYASFLNQPLLEAHKQTCTHVLTEHLDRWLRCDNCDACFLNQPLLEAHKQSCSVTTTNFQNQPEVDVSPEPEELLDIKTEVLDDDSENAILGI